MGGASTLPRLTHMRDEDEGALGAKGHQFFSCVGYFGLVRFQYLEFFSCAKSTFSIFWGIRRDLPNNGPGD